MADFKAFWQRFKSGENGGKGQKDRFMLLALVGLLILVAVWPVGGKSGKTSGQTEASVEKKQETSYNYADQYAAVMESRLKSMLVNHRIASNYIFSNNVSVSFIKIYINHK